MKFKIALALVASFIALAPINPAASYQSTLFYTKLGIWSNPNIALPTFGLGARHQSGNHGFDLSAELSSLIFINRASVKGLYLHYPNPNYSQQLYYGVGGGVSVRADWIPIVAVPGSYSLEWYSANVEGVIGYELRLARHLKGFIQLEVTQPVCHFGPQRSLVNYQPSAAVCLGFGF